MTDSDKTTAPVSNEELYVQTQKLGLLIYASLAMVMAAGSYAAFATETQSGATLGVALLCGTGWVFFSSIAKGFNGRANTLYNAIPSLSTDETVEELDDRLTSSARTDGGSEVTSDE
jgi:hypothetical protein